MRTRNSARLARARRPALSLVLVLATGCFWQDSGGGGGGIVVSNSTRLEFEPNDVATQATTLTAGYPVRGDLSVTGDVDWFFARLTAGATVRIEVWATRLDQASWDAAGTAPNFSIFFPTAADKILEQGTAAGWSFGTVDFDVPTFQLPTQGPSFWLKLEPDIPGQPGGRYVIRLSYISFGPGAHEEETAVDVGGNDSTGTAQAITPGVVNGFHRDGNDDCYAVSVVGPSVLRFELLGQRMGTAFGGLTPFDPLLRLYDVDGTTVLAQNDDAFLADPAIQYEVSAAGKYVVQVTQSPASTTNAKYRLTASTSLATGIAEVEPNDLTVTATSFTYGQNVSGTIGPGEDDWFRFSGTAGDMVRLQVFDGNNAEAASETVVVTPIASDGVTPLLFHEGPLFQVQTTILQSAGTTYLHVQPNPGALGPTSYRLELRRFHASTYETEPNDTLAQAPLFPAGGFASGAILTPADADVWKFTATSHQLVVFDVFAALAPGGTNQASEYGGHGSTLAPLVRVRDANGNALATSTTLPLNGVHAESVADGLPTVAVAFVASASSTTYYVEVASADGTGGADHTYVVQRR